MRILFYFALSAMSFFSFSASDKVSASDFVDLQQGKTVHPTFRRAHAKGFCVSGSFESNGKLAQYTQTPIFTDTVTPFTGRFSIATNNPTAPDLKAPVRSLALSFDISSTQQWRIAMNTPPVMAVSNPHDFYRQLVAIKQGPEAIGQFLKEHPESKDFLEWKQQYRPSSSLALETYHSINAFYLTTDDEKRPVRWHLESRNPSEVVPLDSSDPDALHNELRARLAKSPIIFDWIFTFATPEDDENDPAVAWPENRKQVIAGQVIINAADMAKDAPCHAINFDPLTLPTGVEATADPILRARSAAYAQSYRRRAKETLLQGGN